MRGTVPNSARGLVPTCRGCWRSLGPVEATGGRRRAVFGAGGDRFVGANAACYFISSGNVCFLLRGARGGQCGSEKKVLSIITADRNFYSLYGANENDLQLSRCLPACNITSYLSARCAVSVSLSPQRGAPIHYWHILSRIKTAPETPLAMTCLASQM